jgi:hypothetical protein
MGSLPHMLIQYAGALFAAISAILWVMSARVKIPKMMRLYSHRSDFPPGVQYTHEAIGDVFSPELAETHLALLRQSRLSGYAASCAAAAAACQIWVVLGG